MDIQTLINTPLMRIRIISFVHFSLIVNALLGRWVPPAFTFYNILFMVSLMWAMHCKESVDAIQTAAAINFSSFFFDLIIIISFFPEIGGIWSIIFAVFNMIARPFSLILLHKELVDRGGDFVLVNVVTAQPNNNRQQRNYQDIDRPTPQSNSAQSNLSNLF